MMKIYLEAVLLEQINKAMSLKSSIPKPLKYAEFSGLSSRCNLLLDDIIGKLQFLIQNLLPQFELNERLIMRELRRCSRELAVVESFGISPLNFQEKKTMAYLNKLVFKIHQEINYPLEHPVVAHISTQYYIFQNFTNVIFVPFGESEFLLHLPDLFHELGHGVLEKRDQEPKLNIINEKYNALIFLITEHYRKIISRKRRETGPEEIVYILKTIQENWKNYWIDEFLCDLFALYTLGPAYAYSHLHLTIKNTENPFEFNHILSQSHPSDDSRMEILIMGLEQLGFKNEAVDLTSKWKSQPSVSIMEPVNEYQYAYPKSLLKEVVSIFLYALRESHFQIVSPEFLKNINEKSIIKLLNDAWDIYWVNPLEFRDWEIETVSKLKRGDFF